MNAPNDSDHAAALIWCPFGDDARAREVAEIMVREGLVACANIIPGITSIFRWQGEISHDSESAVLFKTTCALLGEAEERLAQLHPYDIPAIVGWRADLVPKATLGWLIEQTSGAKGGQGARE